MSFPVWITIGPLKLHPHFVLEALAYFIGFRLYLWTRSKETLPYDKSIWVIVGAILGAAFGSKALYWLEDPQLTAANWHDLSYLMEGKTIVGGLLGGLIGVEWIKKRIGVTRSTGDDMALPLAVGSGPKPLKVLYGVVSLSQAGQEGFTEQFIKVSDGTQSVRALSNGWSLLFDGSRPSGSKTEFVTGKKLEGNSVVKDYSGGWKAINLQRSWDVYQNLTDVTLAFTWDLTGGADPFFQQLAQTSYTVDINSWKHVGNQAAVN